METEVTTSRVVGTPRPGFRLNKMYPAVKVWIIRDLAPRVARVVMEGVRERIAEAPHFPGGRVAKCGLGAHPTRGRSA